jgi:hypothetical protein
MGGHRFLILRAAVLLLLIGAVGRADESEVAAKRLASVGSFAFGGVGFAGVTSAGEKDFRLVLSQTSPIALESFEKLYVHGNAQAKAYALVGVRKLNSKRYKELLGTAATSVDKVEVMRGCILTRESLKDIARQIDAGGFDSWVR